MPSERQGSPSGVATNESCTTGDEKHWHGLRWARSLMSLREIVRSLSSFEAT